MRVRLSLGRIPWTGAVLALLGGLFTPPAARAQVPVPALCTVGNVMLSPNGSLAYSVRVQDAAGPINGATVTLVYTPAAGSAGCWCTGQPQAPFTATTNGAGVAVFHLVGGQCIDPATLGGGGAIDVYANGVLLAQVGQVSPDLLNRPSAPPCRVSLVDATNVAYAYSTATYTFCADMNSDAQVNLADVVMFSQAVIGAGRCN